MKPIRPGDLCVIINSANGLNGASVGRKVIVHADAPKGEYDSTYSDNWNKLNDPNHYCPPSPYEKKHSTLGQIWPVTCAAGGTFMSEHGGTNLQYIDVAESWLRKIEPPIQLNSKTTSKELEKH